MAKRFVTMFFIMIGVVIFLLSAFFLVLFMVPGARIFGIKYIVIDTHAVNTGKINISTTFKQKYGNSYFSGNIIVNSDEVPVDVQFTSSGYDYFYQYYDNFSGITTSNQQDPKITIERDDDGNAVFNVDSFDTYIFRNSSTQRYLKLYIPLAKIHVTDGAGKQQYIYGEADPGASLKYTTNLTINTNSADINFYSTETGSDKRAASFNEIKLSTNGNVNYNGTHVKAMKFSFDTNKTVEIKTAISSIVDALNYNIKTSSGNIAAERSLSGDLFAETKNGDVIVNKCKNLTVRTELGDVVPSSNRGINVLGLVDIKTIAGSIDIKSISGSGQNKIETASGTVKISSIKDGDIITHRGSVEIEKLNKMKITSDVGSIYINEVDTLIDVSTKRGKIQLGTEDKNINSLIATSVIGDIAIKNSIGEVFIETIDSDIDFINKNSENITINAGGKLNASKLKGLINLTVSGQTFLDFEAITNTTNIKVENSCKFIEVKALNTTRSSLYYKIAGNPASIYELNNTSLGTNSLKHQDSLVVYGDENRNIKFQIYGDSNDGRCSAMVDVYFDKSN